MDSNEAVKLLVERFPKLLARVDDPSDVTTAAPYFAYGIFATEIVENHYNASFLQDACKFLDELAESGDPLLEEVLVVSVLERLAEDATIAHKVRKQIGTKAYDLMRRVEKEYFGRSTPPMRH